MHFAWLCNAATDLFFTFFNLLPYSPYRMSIKTMMINITPFVLLILLAVLPRCYGTTYEPYDCSHLEYNRCVKIADPLIREAHFIFPDNPEDIDLVCRTWNKFVDCLKRYTDECFSDEQRRKFNKAVSNPIESVHKMCMDPNYQQEYLLYASCIKRTITQGQHCGKSYSLLVDQVSQGDVAVISKATICCSQDRFKKCVEQETRRFCDDGTEQGPALRFSSQIIDKALSFLQDQCYNYIPNSGDCANLLSITEVPDRPYSMSTISSELYPWSTNPGQKLFQHGNDLNTASPETWMPSGIQISTDSSLVDSTQHLGSRTRPASYGRSNSWLETKPQNNVYSNSRGAAMERENIPSQTISPAVDKSNTWPARPDWATTQFASISRNTNRDLTLGNGDKKFKAFQTTETWYPAAGNQLSNEVDEPNQQGLSYKENSAPFLTPNYIPLFCIIVIILFN